MEGWIKLSRCLMDKPIFQNEKLLKVWIWCLLKATHTGYEQLVGLQKVWLEPGQFIFGRKKAAEELSITESTVWRLIQFLADKNNPSLEIVSYTKYSVITIVNWTGYQVEKTDSYEPSNIKVSSAFPEQQINNKWTANEQQVDTNKNVKNDKNEKKNIYTDEFELFWSAYPKQGYQNSKPQSFKNFKSLIKKKVDPKDLIQAAKNYDTDCKTLCKTDYLYKASNFIGQAEYYKSYVDEVWEPAQQELFNSQQKPSDNLQVF